MVRDPAFLAEKCSANLGGVYLCHLHQGTRSASVRTAVILSGDPDETSGRLRMDLGAADCIRKPFTVPELEGHLHRLLAMRADRDEIITPT